MVQWSDGTCGSRAVPWADLKTAGESALIEACNIVDGIVNDGYPGAARVVAVSRGHGNIFHRVELAQTFALAGNLDRFDV